MAFHTAVKFVQALGRCFDMNFYTKLLFCKEVSGSVNLVQELRGCIVEVDGKYSKDLLL